MNTVYCLSIMGTVLRHCGEALISRSRHSLLLPAGVSRLPDRMEFLVARLPGSDFRPEAHLPVLLLRTASSLTELRSAIASDPANVPCEAAIITIGLGGAAGHLAGYCLTACGARPLETVRLVDAGLPLIEFRTFAGNRTSPAEDFIWSRTVGALGDRPWRRL